MIELDHAWTAGFVDADGCISIYKDKRRGYVNISIIVVQKDILPLARLQEIYGADEKIGITKRNGRAYFRLTFCGKRARMVLEHIAPYLVLKAEKARMAIAVHDAKEARPIGAKAQAERLSDSAPAMSGDAIVRAIAN